MRRFRITPGRIALALAATLAGSIGIGYATTLPISSSSLGTASQSLTKSSCTVSGTSSTTDTYIDQNSPNSSFGSNTTMLVQPDTNKIQASLIMFSLSGCSIPTTGGADTATLTLFITNAPSSSRTLTLYPVLQTWSGSSTWNTAHSLQVGSATTSFATGTTNNVSKALTVTIDVDALIKNPNANFGWEILDGGTPAGGDRTTIATSNNGTAARRPTLAINYEK